MYRYICTYVHIFRIEVFLSIWKYGEITFGARGRISTCCKDNIVIRRISKPASPCLGHYTTKFWFQIIISQSRYASGTKQRKSFNWLRLFSSEDDLVDSKT